MKLAIDGQLGRKEEERRKEIEVRMRMEEEMRKRMDEQKMMEEEKGRARRAYLEYLMEENKKLLEYRDAVEKKKQMQEIEDDLKRPNFYEKLGRQPF